MQLRCTRNPGFIVAKGNGYVEATTAVTGRAFAIHAINKNALLLQLHDLGPLIDSGG